MSRKRLSELRKYASDGTFHLLRRPNERGKRQVEEGHKGKIWNIINIFSIKRNTRSETRRV
jgi:hypothetical protein